MQSVNDAWVGEGRSGPCTHALRSGPDCRLDYYLECAQDRLVRLRSRLRLVHPEADGRDLVSAVQQDRRLSHDEDAMILFRWMRRSNNVAQDAT